LPWSTSRACVAPGTTRRAIGPWPPAFPFGLAPQGRRGPPSFEPPLLEVKPTPTGCGGIAISPEPMGQIGAEYLRGWGTFVLDPFNEQVWVKKSNALR
jgi:hypothetical protein